MVLRRTMGAFKRRARNKINKNPIQKGGFGNPSFLFDLGVFGVYKNSIRYFSGKWAVLEELFFEKGIKTLSILAEIL